MQPRLTPQARSLLRKQRFIVATWQGPGCGLSPRAIRSAGRRRDWRRVTNRTYLAIDAEPDPAALRVAGTLELGPAALLSGLAALVEHGWQGDPGSPVDVLMPRGTNLTARAALPWWLRVHVRRDPSDAPGVVPLAAACEAVLDAASWARTDREAMFILVSALQQRITTASAVERALGRQRRHRIRLMREILAEFRSGATSMGELDLRNECRRRGLPEPIGQRVRRDSEGRIRFIDAEFVAADGVPVLVEIDGTGHFRPEAWLGDVRRQRKVLVPDGTRWLRVTTWELRYEPEVFFDDLRRALRVAGSDV